MHTVQAEDYDLHMANVGQAEANAELVRDCLSTAGIPDGARVLLAGAGTGQMFEFVSAEFLQPFKVVFTDINSAFLELLSERATRAGMQNFESTVDDIEESKLEPGFGAIIVVLVLEHVDWKRAASSLVKLAPERLLLVVQRNSPDMESLVTPHRELPGSLKAVAEEGLKASLVDHDELIAHLESIGFVLDNREARPVPDGKEMHCLQFRPK